MYRAIGYSPTLLDHLRSPRNAGLLENADGVGRARSDKCGDRIEVYVRLEVGRLADVRFQAVGCAVALAGTSAVTELAQGRTVAEAVAIDAQAVVAALGGVPEERVPCAGLGVRALGEALRQAAGTDLTPNPLPSEEGGQAPAFPHPLPLGEGGRGDRSVVVAMSGGVDSSVAAALLVEQGLNVTGMMLRLWTDPSCDGPNRCCSTEAEETAMRVCARLGIPLRVIDAGDEFYHSVVEPFVADYAAGRTPNPCIVCNRRIKFGLLLQHALTSGAEALATGHYARVRQEDGRFILLRGVDRAKDQSYVLYMLGQNELGRVRFPLGEFTKAEVREMARERGLASAERPESQEVCFLPDNDYRRFIRERAPAAAIPGPIVNRQGQVMGRHNGIAFYTIGQREGLGIAHHEPLYVAEIRVRDNALVVVPARELGRTTLVARDVVWTGLSPNPLPHREGGQTQAFLHPLPLGEGGRGVRCTAQIRYHGAEVPCALRPLTDGEWSVEFERPLRDITPGQAVVFYEGERVLGGGIIAGATGAEG